MHGQSPKNNNYLQSPRASKTAHLTKNIGKTTNEDQSTPKSGIVP